MSKPQKIASILSSLALGISISVAIGWQFDIAVLKSIFPGFISMKINTALGLFLFSLSGLFLTFGNRLDLKIKWSVSTFVFLASSLGALTLAEYIYGVNFGIDEFFFKDLEGIGKLYPPGRLAPVTAVSFMLLGLGVSLTFLKSSSHYRIAQGLLFTVFLVSIQAVVSYALGIETTFGLAAHTRIALHTAIGFISLSIAFLSLDAERGFVQIVCSKNQAGAAARRLIFAALFVPPLVNFIQHSGVKYGLYDHDFGSLISVLGSMLFFVILVLYNSELLFSAEEERNRALSEVIEKEKESARLIAEREVTLQREQFEANLRAELIEARLKAERAAGAKADFLANMSHEIRTPLNGVIGIGDLLSETPLNEQQKLYVQTLQTAGTGLLSIINDILDFSKIEAGKLQLEYVTFNIKGIIQSQIDLLKSQAQQKGLRLETTFDPALPSHVSGDPGRIGQVLLNLIGNAIKFTETGSILIHTVAKETGEAGKVEIKISVTDTGIGLTPEAQAKLFDPFVQADNSTSRKFGGTGLGLSICRSLVQLMGGEVGLQSVVNVGSTFWFTTKLNVVTKAIVSDPTSQKSLRFSAQRKSGKAIRILVAEDNVVNQMIVMAHLKSLGLEGQTVANGHEVIEALKIGNFDLILMDCQMPEMDGYTATHKIREHEAGSSVRIPIIALTANAMKEDQEKCLKAGMDAYLSKPFKKEALEALLIRLLPDQIQAA